MTNRVVKVIGGVDTHKRTHYAAVIDDNGRQLGHREFPAHAQGYGALLKWLRSHGDIVAIGVESSGSFRATLTRFITEAGEAVVEVNKPNRLARHMDGKTDRLDAEQIARSVLAGTGSRHRNQNRARSRSPASCESLEQARSGPAPRRSTTCSAR